MMYLSNLWRDLRGSEEVKLDLRRDAAVWEKDVGKISILVRHGERVKLHKHRHDSGRAMEIPAFRVKG